MLRLPSVWIPGQPAHEYDDVTMGHVWKIEFKIVSTCPTCWRWTFLQQRGEDETRSCASIRTAGLMFIHDVLIIILGSSAGLRRILYNIPLKSVGYFNMSISVGVTAGLTFVEDARGVQLLRHIFYARSLLRKRGHLFKPGVQHPQVL
jgi:hypothetical protein